MTSLSELRKEGNDSNDYLTMNKEIDDRWEEIELLDKEYSE